MSSNLTCLAAQSSTPPFGSRCVDIQDHSFAPANRDLGEHATSISNRVNVGITLSWSLTSVWSSASQEGPSSLPGVDIFGAFALQGGFAAIREALSAVDRKNVRGIGVSGQQHGFVPLDAEKQVNTRILMASSS